MDVIDGLEIKRTTAAEQVAEALRAKILGGELRPGAPLPELAIAASTGVSRNTIRDAIRLLGREGLVRITIHHGATVTELKPEDVADIFRIRRELEIHAIEAIKKEKSSFDAAPLFGIIEDMEKAIVAKNWPRFAASDRSFHQHLVAFMGSERLNGFLLSLLSELSLALVLVDSSKSDTTRLIEQHRTLANLLRDKKFDECISELIAHLRDSEREVLSVVSTQPGV
jgi:DNA-binding GntR family transcriptional regulator